MARLPPRKSEARVIQEDARSRSLSFAAIVSTDPPYYDNIGYADLSGFLLRVVATFPETSTIRIYSPRWRSPRLTNSLRLPTATVPKSKRKNFL